MKLARLSKLQADAKDLLKMLTQQFLALLHPLLHIWPSLVDVTVSYPVLGHFSKETQVCDGDLVTSYKLPVFQEVIFNDVKGLPQFFS